MNIFSNFIPNKLVTFDDKDQPWMTPNLITEKKLEKWYLQGVYKE